VQQIAEKINERSDVRQVPERALPPQVWVLASPRAGDNTQLLALAEALGWPFAVKRLVYRPVQTLARLMLGATLAGLDRRKSDAIAPPFPDLIIGAGRANEAVALWLRRNSGPKPRLVYLGTPWAALDQFDLVITTPQYRLPKRPNVLHNALPLHDVEPGKLAAAASAWQKRLTHLPRPWIAVLAGGPSGPYTFSPAAAARLGEEASALTRGRGGSLLVTTSARTPPAVADALAQAITAPSYFYRWTALSDDNPLTAYLALGDEFIITADSISMLTEACATGKPVMLFDTEEGRQAMRAEEGLATAQGRLPPLYWRGRDVNSTFFRLALSYAPVSWSRDLRIVHRALRAAGRVSWLGDPAPKPRPLYESEDMARAVARIRALFSSD